MNQQKNEHKNRRKNQQKATELVLRIGVSGMFLGHGVFALSAKVGWIPLITAFGFSEAAAVTLMPFIGVMDLLVAFFTLFWPLRIVLCWATIWAFATGLARPIAGEPIWDFIERFANWAAPLALLMLQGFPRKLKDLFKVR